MPSVKIMTGLSQNLIHFSGIWERNRTLFCPALHWLKLQTHIRTATAVYLVQWRLVPQKLGEELQLLIVTSLIWRKTLMELIFNPFGEFLWSPKSQVSQIHSPRLLVGAPCFFFSDLLRFVQMLKREWGAKRNGKLPNLFNP